MRLFIRVVAFSLLACVGLWRPCRADSFEGLQIRKLIIESKSLPERDRRQVVRQFQGRSYPGSGGNVSEDTVLEELGERIRMSLRELGYFRSLVDEPTVSHVTSSGGKRIAEVRVRVSEGLQYGVGEIQFTGAKAFPSDRLRAAFDLQKGMLFNATKFGAGLEDLRKLYASEGYVNVAEIPNPIVEESLHVIDFTIDIDEGATYNFGRLILDGPEPHAGAGYALLDAWSVLAGKGYNSLLLQQWLAANRANWQDGSHEVDPTTSRSDPESRVVNVKLSFPEDP